MEVPSPYYCRAERMQMHQEGHVEDPLPEIQFSTRKQHNETPGQDRGRSSSRWSVLPQNLLPVLLSTPSAGSQRSSVSSERSPLLPVTQFSSRSTRSRRRSGSRESESWDMNGVELLPTPNASINRSNASSPRQRSKCLSESAQAANNTPSVTNAARPNCGEGDVRIADRKTEIPELPHRNIHVGTAQEGCLVQSRLGAVALASTIVVGAVAATIASRHGGGGEGMQHMGRRVWSSALLMRDLVLDGQIEWG